MVEQGPPRFSSGPADVVSHAGGKASFGADVSGTSPLAFQWFHDGASIEGATSRYLLLTNVPLSDSGTYTLVAGNVTGLTNWLNSSLDVQSAPAVAGNPCAQECAARNAPLPERRRFRAWNRSACNGASTGLTCRTGHDSVALPIRVLCLDGAKSEDSGSYSLVASNAYGSVTGLVAQVSVSSIIAWGDNSAQQLNVPIGTVDVVSIAAGGDHCLALRADGFDRPVG